MPEPREIHVTSAPGTRAPRRSSSLAPAFPRTRGAMRDTPERVARGRRESAACDAC
ncbi:hypothetical protein SSBG_04979 [Streptomyces sp. SPB074]|nr:hypothetical protein SSBG_04979 [Streptomyces sp. SPB074]